MYMTDKTRDDIASLWGEYRFDQEELEQFLEVLEEEKNLHAAMERCMKEGIAQDLFTLGLEGESRQDNPDDSSGGYTYVNVGDPFQVTLFFEQGELYVSDIAKEKWGYEAPVPPTKEETKEQQTKLLKKMKRRARQGGQITVRKSPHGGYTWKNEWISEKTYRSFCEWYDRRGETRYPWWGFSVRS